MRRARLKDPNSATFRDSHVSAPASSLGGATVVCGYVNARNGFGGFTGDQKFFVGGSARVEGDPSLNAEWLDYCRR